MYLLLAYDITSPSRGQRFHRKAREVLVPVQKSVMEGPVRPAGLTRLETLITRLDLESDHVRVYTLCRACQGMTRTWGPALDLPDPHDPTVVR